MSNTNAPKGGDQNRALSILTLTWIEWSLSCAVVVLRIIARVKLTRHVGLDDLFIVICLVLSRSISSARSYAD